MIRLLVACFNAGTDGLGWTVVLPEWVCDAQPTRNGLDRTVLCHLYPRLEFVQSYKMPFGVGVEV